jgi:hypothetical protein
MASCTYKGTDFPPGTVICMEGTENRCRADGSWENLGKSCVQGDGIVVQSAEGENPLPAD